MSPRHSGPLRCLHVVPQGVLSPRGKGGGPAVFHDHHLSLAAAGCDVSLWHFAYAEQRRDFDQFVSHDDEHWAAVRAASTGVTLSTFSKAPPLRARILTRLARRSDRFVVRNPVLRIDAVRVLARLIDEVEPDVIWAQTFAAAQVACLQRDVPVVYSHHDWLYRLRAAGTGKTASDELRRDEEAVARAAAVVVTGSMTEAHELRTLGCRHVHYVPLSVDPVEWPATPLAHATPHVVHLGAMSTTASREGLTRFLDVVWPKIAELGLPFDVVGTLEGAPPELAATIRGAATCPGYVADLTTVLRPFDLHVIPWEHATGQRTRLPLAFAHGQVVVATSHAVACYPEAVDGVNCRLVDRLEDAPQVIRDLAGNPDERTRLGLGARATAAEHFSRDSQLERFRAVVRDAVDQRRVQT